MTSPGTCSPPRGARAGHLLAATVREQVPRLVAGLARRFSDFDLAEEAVQQAVVEALATWRRDGVPDRPGAWLQVAAQRNALDLIRADRRRRGRVERLAASTLTGDFRGVGSDVAREEAAEPALDGNVADDRLALLFACCHPALAVEARLALTLRAVMGLTTPQISRAFMVPEATLAQRIVRAKRKIVANGIRLAVPDEDRSARLRDVLAVVYLTYNEAFVSSTGATQDRDLAAEAVWLAEAIATGLPDEAEAWGLAALLTAQHARAAARFDPSGGLVLLRDQDRTRWDREAIARAERHLERAAALRRPGPYQLQAAIAGCHATAGAWADTDWLQIVTLYDALCHLDPSPVPRLNRAVAVAELEGDPERALAEVDALAESLEGYHLLHATRAELLRRAGRPDEAAAADRRAEQLTANAAERRLIQTRLRRHALTDGS